MSNQTTVAHPIFLGMFWFKFKKRVPNAGTSENENNGVGENIPGSDHGVWKTKNGDPDKHEPQPEAK